jgi:hypothetical protein
MAVSLEGLTPEAIADLAALSKSLSDNPKTRGHFLNLLKHADPSMSIPEVDIPARVAAASQPYREKLAAMEAKQMERDVMDNIRERRQNLMDSKGLSKADVAEVEKLMVERGISNHETAADFLLSQRQAATPTPSTGGFSQPSMPKPDLKGMGVNLNAWARNTATSAVADIIKNRKSA